MEIANWAGNQSFRPQRFHEPSSVKDLQQIVGAAQHVRALGTRHSFNDIADTSGDLVSLANLPTVLDIDESNCTVTANAGARYAELGSTLHERGWALANTASLPHISLGGAIATGTHGSGSGNGNLATAAVGFEMVTADGDRLRFSAGDTDFHGAVMGLGAIGVVTEYTLAIQPTFDVAQTVFTDASFDSVVDHFDAVMDAAYSVSMFTKWIGPTVDQIWVKRRTDQHEVPLPVDALRAVAQLHPVPDVDATACTIQGGVAGPWIDRLPHFRVDARPSAGHEIQSEYLMPRSCARQAIDAVRHVGDHLAEQLLISEIRTIASDDLWLSPNYQQDSVAFHFTWRPNWEAVRQALEIVERALEPFSPRPHWGKTFLTTAAEIASFYPKVGDFRTLCTGLDPSGKFRNDFTSRYIFGGDQ